MAEPHLHDEFLMAIEAFEDERFQDTLTLCARILDSDATHVKALALCALTYEKINNIDNALIFCKALLSINSQNAPTLALQGALLAKQAKFQEALDSFNQSLEINPQDIKTLQNCGLTLIKLNEPEKALAHFDKALRIDSSNSELLINKAYLLLELHRYKEALHHYDKAFSIDPHHTDAMSDRGNALMGLKRYDEALASYAAALAINPKNKFAHYSEAYCRLLIGDLLNGWRKYEYRWEVTQQAAKRVFAQPLWLGKENLAGKTLLIHAEQGHGDTIQFSRYIPMLRALGADVYFEAYRDLQLILEPLVAPQHFITRGQPLPETDYHCPLLSLPLAFETQMDSIPHNTPYIRAPITLSHHATLLLPPSSKPRIGLVWQANEANDQLAFRSIDLEKLLRITTDDYCFVILQKKLTSAQESLIAQYPHIIDMHAHLHTFGETAAIIDQLDLIISVDTSVAHLAGAMHRPVWILLSENANWRWLINRKDSPWYPSATLFRQRVFNQWNDVIDDIHDALAAFFKISD